MPKAGFVLIEVIVAQALFIMSIIFILRLHGNTLNLNKKTICQMHAMNKALFSLQSNDVAEQKSDFFEVKKCLMPYKNKKMKLRIQSIKVRWQLARKKHILHLIG